MDDESSEELSSSETFNQPLEYSQQVLGGKSKIEFQQRMMTGQAFTEEEVTDMDATLQRNPFKFNKIVPTSSQLSLPTHKHISPQDMQPTHILTRQYNCDEII